MERAAAADAEAERLSEESDERRRRFAHVQTTFTQRETGLNGRISELETATASGSAADRYRMEAAAEEVAKLRMLLDASKREAAGMAERLAAAEAGVEAAGAGATAAREGVTALKERAAAAAAAEAAARQG